VGQIVQAPLCMTQKEDRLTGFKRGKEEEIGQNGKDAPGWGGPVMLDLAW